jgi:uncharacterized protein
MMIEWKKEEGRRKKIDMGLAKISAEQMAVYQRTARRREAERQRAAAARRERAWLVAAQAAEVLKQQFGAERVVAFGSLVDNGRFRADSDIDLAVYGIEPARFLKAWHVVDELAPDIDIDLVDMAVAKEWVHQVLAERGVDL